MFEGLLDGIRDALCASPFGPILDYLLGLRLRRQELAPRIGEDLVALIPDQGQEICLSFPILR